MAKVDGTFLYIGTYAGEAAARDDYAIVKDLHTCLLYTSDAADE